MKTKLTFHNNKFEDYTPRIVALCLLTILLVIALTGCKKESSNTPSNVHPGLPGVYTPLSIDDKIVPCEISHEGAAMTIKSGAFILRAGGRCSSMMNISVGAGKDINLERKASFISQGAEHPEQWEGAGTTLGSVHDISFTMTHESVVFSCQKGCLQLRLTDARFRPEAAAGGSGAPA